MDHITILIDLVNLVRYVLIETMLQYASMVSDTIAQGGSNKRRERVSITTYDINISMGLTRYILI